MAKKERKPRRKADFMTYLLWRSIPSIIRTIYKKQGKEKIQELGFDTDDEIFMLLINLDTRTKFIKEFSINKNTITNWENRSDFNNELNRVIEKVNVLQFKKDVDYHFARATIKNADAARVKLFKQLYEGWVEKSEQKNTDTLAVDVAGILKAKEELKEKEDKNANTDAGGAEPSEPDNSDSE